jgi:hypothetical protein
LIDIFFYGLFMDPELLRANGFQPANGRRACVSGMALRIGRRATLVPDPTGTVHGFVFGLTHQEIDRLYQEPSVAIYRPEAVIARLELRTARPFPRSASIFRRRARQKLQTPDTQKSCGTLAHGWGCRPTILRPFDNGTRTGIFP